MTSLTVLLAAVVVSIAAVVLGRRALGLNPTSLSPAAGTALEVLGLAVVFLSLDVALAGALGLVGRAVGQAPLSLHLPLAGLTGLAVAQALVFHAWRASARPPR